MKDYSVSQIKRSLKNPRAKIAIQRLPKAGSKVRELFDLFQQFKGQLIDLGTFDKLIWLRIKYLKDMYGMDIVHVSKGRWRLHGEYVGSKYVIYVDDHPNKIKVKQKET